MVGEGGVLFQGVVVAHAGVRTQVALGVAEQLVQVGPSPGAVQGADGRVVAGPLPLRAAAALVLRRLLLLAGVAVGPHEGVEHGARFIRHAGPFRGMAAAKQTNNVCINNNK